MPITTSRPAKRVSATAAPRGTPISAPKTTADRLTRSDRRTIASRAGSPLSTNWSAETLSGMTAPLAVRLVAFRPETVNYRNIFIYLQQYAYAGLAYDRGS